MGRPITAILFSPGFLIEVLIKGALSSSGRFTRNTSRHTQKTRIVSLEVV